MSEEKKNDEKKVNKSKQFLIKIKEVFINFISHSIIGKNINYISFAAVLILLILYYEISLLNY